MYASPGIPICNSGAAYIFRFDHETSRWTEEQKLLASDAACGDHFGHPISISGNAALVGAHGDNSNSGSAYVFRFDPENSQWVEEQKLLASDGAAGDQFARAVAIDGDTAVIGAWVSDAGGPSSGAAYIFRLDPKRSQWVQQQQLLPEPNPWTNFFGWSVAIQGDTVVFGAHGEDHQAGAAYVLDLAACLCPADLDGDGSVGILDLLSLLAAWGTDPGGVAVIGAWVSDAGGPSSGAAYIFRLDPKRSQWVQQQQLLPEPNPWTNFFGWSVAIQGDTVVFGAHGEDHQAGAAYVLDLAACLCPADLDGDGSVGILDLLSLLAAWGTDPGGPPDFDDDGNVGILDLLTLLANWGPCA